MDYGPISRRPILYNIGVDINGYTVIVRFCAWYSYVHRELVRNDLGLILGYIVHIGFRFGMVPLV